jgi:hypothetical protein
MEDSSNNEQTSLLRQQEAVVDIVESITEIEATPVKRNWKYWFIWFWRLCIFAITGSSSIRLTRLLLTRLLHLNGKVCLSLL